MLVASVVIPVFAIVAAGALYGKMRGLPSKELADLVMWVLLPCLVLGSIGSQPLDPRVLLEIGASAIGVLLASGGLAWALFFKRPERRALVLSTAFMNSANMAFPLALFAFGKAGLQAQVLFYVAVHLLHVTAGIALARGRGGLWEMLKLPLPYAAVLAVTLALAEIRLPAEVTEPLDLVGKATIPLMLLMLGARLVTVRLGQLGLALAASLLRIGIGFLAGLAMVELLGLEGIPRAAVLIGASMPSAVLNVVLTERYDNHPDCAASVVALSTLISVGTTPLLLWFLSW